MNRKDLQVLARTRLKEAATLFEADLFDGAYYLAGYAVEFGLKACIAKRTKRYDFPDKKSVDASHTHNLKDLVRLANLEGERVAAGMADAGFRDNWELVLEWSEHSRYRKYDSERAKNLLESVADRKHGVMTWIKRYW